MWKRNVHMLKLPTWYKNTRALLNHVGTFKACMY